MSDSKLPPCPFCGSDPYQSIIDNTKVWCSNESCVANIRGEHITPEEWTKGRCRCTLEPVLKDE